MYGVSVNLHIYSQLSAMNKQMPDQLCADMEGLLTIIAHEHFVFIMRDLMPFQALSIASVY